MTAAFMTAALGAGFAVAGLSALVVWVMTLLTGSTEPWGVAVWLIPAVGVVSAVATYVAEVIVERSWQSRKRATGEPWAYRDDS